MLRFLQVLLVVGFSINIGLGEVEVSSETAYPEQNFLWDAQDLPLMYVFLAEYSYIGIQTGKSFRVEQADPRQYLKLPTRWSIKKLSFVERRQNFPLENTICVYNGVKLSPLSVEVGRGDYRWSVKREFMPFTMYRAAHASGGEMNGMRRLKPGHVVEMCANELHAIPMAIAEVPSGIDEVQVYDMPILKADSKRYALRIYLIKNEQSMGKQMAAEGEIFLEAFEQTMAGIKAPYVKFKEDESVESQGEGVTY